MKQSDKIAVVTFPVLFIIILIVGVSAGLSRNPSVEVSESSIENSTESLAWDSNYSSTLNSSITEGAYIRFTDAWKSYNLKIGDTEKIFIDCNIEDLDADNIEIICSNSSVVSTDVRKGYFGMGVGRWRLNVEGISVGKTSIYLRAVDKNGDIVVSNTLSITVSDYALTDYKHYSYVDLMRNMDGLGLGDVLLKGYEYIPKGELVTISGSVYQIIKNSGDTGLIVEVYKSNGDFAGDVCVTYDKRDIDIDLSVATKIQVYGTFNGGIRCTYNPTSESPGYYTTELVHIKADKIVVTS